jgi:Uma2 family endonuclease
LTWNPPDDEQWFVIAGIDYATYVKVNDAFGDDSPRMTFDGERLILMGNSSRHARWSRLFGRLICTLTQELKLPVISCGDMTCRTERSQRGLEPDECFYIQNEPALRGRLDLDLDADPPPDLAIEVDVSRQSVGRLPIYAKLKVPEAWRFNGQEVLMYVLQADGNYQLTDRSRAFPHAWLTGARLARWIAKSQDHDENALLSKFRRWVRKQVRGT